MPFPIACQGWQFRAEFLYAERTPDSGRVPPSLGGQTAQLGNTGLVGDDHHIEITSGLEFGAQVIRADMGNLTPGTPVRVNAASKR